MGDIGEVTASTLSAHQDIVDLEAEGKRGLTDYNKLEAEIEKLKLDACNVSLLQIAILDRAQTSCWTLFYEHRPLRT